MDRIMSPGLPALPSRKVVIAALISVFALTGAIYWVSLWNDFVRLDDGLLIYENPAVRQLSLSSLRTIFTTYDPELYIPLTLFCYQLLYLVSGTNAFAYHLLSLLLHLGSTAGVMWLGYLLTQRRSAALIAGVLFAIHPLQVEAVAWAAALKDQLSTFFLLAALISFLYWKEDERTKLPKWSLVFFFLGLLSKVMILTLPVLLLLIEDLRSEQRWPFLRISWWRERLAWLWPYVALSVVFLLVALYGKREIVSTMSPWQTLLMATKSTVTYLEKMFWPSGLSVLYPHTGPIGLHSLEFLFTASSVLLLVMVALVSRRYTKWVSFGVFFFLLTLLPTFTNFAKGGDIFFASDRYAYVPSIGFFIALAFFVGWLWDGRDRQWQRIGLSAFGIVLVFGLSWQTHAQSLTWKNTETLFTHVLEVFPEEASTAYNNLGNAYRRQGRLEEAITEFEKALKIRDHVRTRSNYAATLGSVGRFDEALREFQKAQQLDPHSELPDLGRGILYAKMGKVDLALQAYAAAIEKNPRLAMAYTNRGSLLFEYRRVDEAITDFRNALDVEPMFVQARYNLAIALQSQQKFDEAAQEYLEVINEEPRYTQARLNVGVILAKQGKLPESQAQFQAVLNYAPGNPEATEALRRINAAMGR